MANKRILSVLVVGAMAIAGAFGAILYQNVSAQAPTPTATPSAQNNATSPAQPGTTQAQPGAGKGNRGNFQGTNQDQQLADALGITLDKLQSAEKSASAEALKQAVAKGLLTQAQADQIAAGPDGGMHFRGMKDAATSGIDYNALLANALGITSDQLKAAQQKVFDANLASAVSSGAMTQDQADLIKARQALESNSKFQSSLQSAYTAAVQQAVTDGVITQAQADAILKAQSTMGFGMGGRGFGFDGGFGGRGGHGRGGPNGAGSQTSPSTPDSSAPAAPATN